MSIEPSVRGSPISIELEPQVLKVTMRLLLLDLSLACLLSVQVAHYPATPHPDAGKLIHLYKSTGGSDGNQAAKRRIILRAVFNLMTSMGGSFWSSMLEMVILNSHLSRILRVQEINPG